MRLPSGRLLEFVLLGVIIAVGIVGLGLLVGWW
jgi:hypothetical protein